MALSKGKYGAGLVAPTSPKDGAGLRYTDPAVRCGAGWELVGAARCMPHLGAPDPCPLRLPILCCLLAPLSQPGHPLQHMHTLGAWGGAKWWQESRPARAATVDAR